MHPGVFEENRKYHQMIELKNKRWWGRLEGTRMRRTGRRRGDGPVGGRIWRERGGVDGEV